MLANWVRETTATVGAGTITLAGAVTGFIAFGDAFANTDRVLYTIEDGNNREVGYGTYTAAGTLLSRDQIIKTLVAGVYDDTSPAAISLSGSAVIFSSPLSESVIPFVRIPKGQQKPHNIDRYDFSGKGGGEFTAIAGQIVFTPIVFIRPTLIKTVWADITTISAGGNFRLALYTASVDGKPNELLFDTGNLSTAVTGMIGFTLTPELIVPPGNYYMADAVDNTTAQASGIRTTSGMSMWFAGDSAKYTIAQAYGAFPANGAAAVAHNNWASFGSFYA